jgi:hypothetical protein
MLALQHLLCHQEMLASPYVCCHQHMHPLPLHNHINVMSICIVVKI